MSERPTFDPDLIEWIPDPKNILGGLSVIARHPLPGGQHWVASDPLDVSQVYYGAGERVNPIYMSARIRQLKARFDAEVDYPPTFLERLVQMTDFLN